MTIPAQTIFNQYTANGVTTAFAYGFKITDAADLQVSVNGVVITTGFTISGVGVDGGGSVTFAVAPLNTLIVLIELFPIIKRVTDYPQFGDFPAPIVNNDFDRLVLMIQKAYQDIKLSFKLPTGSTANTTLPNPVGSSFIGWNALGTQLINYAGVVGTAVSVFMDTVLNAVDAAAARLILGAAQSGDNTDITSIQGSALSSGVPLNSKSAAYTTTLADANTCILHPSTDNNARTFTIDSNANVAYPLGTTLVFANKVNTVTIAITSDTLTLAGAGTTGSRSLASNGLATAVKISATEWMISGLGLT